MKKMLSILIVSLFVASTLYAANSTTMTDSMIVKSDIGTYVDGELQIR